MECEEGTQEWTFDLEVDPDSTGTGSRLIFCMRFPASEAGEISGQVLDTDGNHLSPLEGRIQPFRHAGPGLGASLVSLDFALDQVKIVMSGLKLGPVFEGRFRAYAAAAFAAAAPSGSVPTVKSQAPGDGDTGTGTGTQT